MEKDTLKRAISLFFMWMAACAPDDPPLEGTTAGSTIQAPRILPDKALYGRLDAHIVVERIVVKFQEGTHVRLRAGVLEARSLERSAREQSTLASLNISEDMLRADLSRVNSTFEGRMRSLFAESENRLVEKKRSGESASGRELADLNLYIEIPLAVRSRFGEVATLVDSLNMLGSVEIAYAQPSAVPALVDIPPVTPSFEAEQSYLNAAPSGIDARYAWTIPGGNGAGVRIVDIEGDWRTTHEDMPALFHQGGGVKNDLGWRNHGTAVLGVMIGGANAYGVTGIVWGATAGYESIASQSTASAVIKAANAAQAGGVVLIELHASGPAGTMCNCNLPQCGYVPMEYWQAEFDAIETASANGIIVVEAAGNGSANLDNARYGSLFNRTVRDSGAILVGAGNGAGRMPTCWTNHGSRIDAFGWGEGVMTMGYGWRFNPGDENQFYTSEFNGTSSASPVVVGAVASVQGVVRGEERAALTTWQMRDLLFRTGTPQAGGAQHIARMPNLRAAIDDIRSPFQYSFAGVADWDRDGHQDIITRGDTGLLWLHLGQSVRGYSNQPRVQIGNGWNDYTFAGVADWDRDGHQDIITRDNTGLLWLYPGQSVRGYSGQPPVQIGNGWNNYTFAGVADWDRDGHQDIIARDNTGLLWLYPGQSVRGYSGQSPVQIGNGWNNYSFAGVADWDRDGHQDIITRDNTSLLWLYPGQSVRGYSNQPPVQIGNGW